MTDVRLVKKAKRGNKEALLQLIMAQKDAYYRLAFTYMENPHDAMDSMEEMIVILYEKIHQLKNEEAFYSWSKTVLVNCCKTSLRKQKRVVLVEEWEPTYETVNDQTLINDPYKNSEYQMDINASLRILNKYQKEAVQLKYFHDYDYETIARLTNVSVGTVKSRVFQGLKKLREYYGGELDE
ncbi:sigma-70 family RNA polymerase sigma factor [Bacillus sp. JJ1521]|uniref:sigma-70 family RNA polymerase sigma factor n=1 Tax=Bacillus sp. JJ1521 TaxID=3122957 RepID=UPI002FFEB652